jgi:hypothetical protein
MTLANKNKNAARVGLGTFVQVCGFPPIRLRDVEWMGHPRVSIEFHSHPSDKNKSVARMGHPAVVGWLRFEKLRVREPADVGGI